MQDEICKDKTIRLKILAIDILLLSMIVILLSCNFAKDYWQPKERNF
jgi:hypothetical protein